jgi:hypothetical protein
MISATTGNHCPPGDRGIECGEDQTENHDQGAALRVTIRHGGDPPIWKHRSNRVPHFEACYLTWLLKSAQGFIICRDSFGALAPGLVVNVTRPSQHGGGS